MWNCIHNKKVWNNWKYVIFSVLQSSHLLLWLLLCTLLAFSWWASRGSHLKWSSNSLEGVLREMLSTCWPFCLLSAVQLTPKPSRLGSGPVTVEARSSGAAPHHSPSWSNNPWCLQCESTIFIVMKIKKTLCMRRCVQTFGLYCYFDIL